ncbi:DUF4382 domain-containing protein [Hydrogenophaga sp.]|uniref:DUF4382 domain-containing protein n=1 Tax=Hydrogenophaga sp. TaxID=1904254 RepID=UPI00262B02D8|nr:DUF4382 domain-containing protein [Hydrogenophaga sp.]MDM7951064.1 DUF4382 domain-containing protein [Hydrogenophaga sp.]
MKIKTIHTALAATAAALLIGLVGCGGGGDGGISGTGVMRLSLTDAPACGYDEVNITIEKVRVNQSSDANEGDGGWSEVVLNPAKRVDLLTLTNGILEELGETSLPAGKYTQMRLVLAANSGATPFANSVIPTGGVETPLATPSGQQSGLKLNVNMDVAAGELADFVIDFDACKSVVRRGNSGQYNLKPVISVIPRLSDAGLRVVGYVDTAIANGSTTVSVQQGGVPIKATVPDASGTFVLYPVPVGTYDLVIRAAERVTAVMTGVPVVATSITTVNSTSFAFLPQPSTSTTVTGTVTPTTATVRALQSLTGGPTVEVAWASVDADTGLFETVLPDAAPASTAYVANATTAYAFTPDAAIAGLYTLQASLDGSPPQSQSIDTGALPPSILFSFP